MLRQWLKILDKIVDSHFFKSPVEETLKIFRIMGWGRRQKISELRRSIKNFKTGVFQF